MKCPSCGKELVFEEKTNRYVCKYNFCDFDGRLSKEFGEFEADVSMRLTDNRVYGEITIAINIKNKEAIFFVSHRGLLPGDEPFTYGPISVNKFDIKQLSYNELAFSFNDPYFAGFIAKGSNRDTTFFIYRLIETLKQSK